MKSKHIFFQKKSCFFLTIIKSFFVPLVIQKKSKQIQL